MDKLNQYRIIIQKELEERATYTIANAPLKKHQLIIDHTFTQFILLSIGWKSKHYTDTIVYHIELKNNKVWVHQDNTDVGIAQVFADLGIPKSDIILAFLPTYAQELSEFATAA